MSSQYEKIVGDFKPGSIICLKLKNFLTYTKVEIRPGPRMNMVIGANGTGKSSILCALCLGLGGEPKLLGRADDARSFIMHEQEKAQISVTLAPFPDEEPHELIRVIDRSKGSDKGNGRGASTFFINKQKASIKEVQQLVRETYKIAVDNLCQFLPQDLVGSFSGFNQKQLLVETEKSIGGDSMYNKHQNLIKYEKEQQSGDSNVDSIKAKLEKLETEKQRFEREKERMEERNKALQQVEQHRKVIAWKDMQLKLEQYHSLKEEKKRLKNEYKQAMLECQPFEERVVELEERKKEAEALFKKRDQQVGKHKADMEKQQIKNEKHEDEMDNTLLELQKVETDRAKKLQEVKGHKARVESLQQNLEEMGNTEEVNQEFQEAAKIKQKAHKACANARKEASELANEFKEHEGKAEQVTSRLAKLQDEKTQRKQHLYRHQPNLAKICNWLDQNRKIFRRQVWGPVAVEVSLKTANAAAYLEQHCANTVLTSFVVESKEDYDRLYKEARSNLKLPVNVILVRNGRLQDIQRPVGEEKMAELKRNHGVIGYLDEAFTAPDAVLEALRAMSAVHKVLVGGDETQKSIDERGLLEFLAEPDQRHGQRGKQGSCIFASKNHSSKKYTQSVSRYSGHISSRDDDVRPARLLAKGGDPEVKTRLETELKALHDSMNALRPKMEDADRKKAQLEQAGQQASDRTSQAKEKLELFKKYKSKLANANSKLRDAEKDLSTDDRSQKRKLLKIIMTRVGNIVSALEGHAKSHEKLLEATISNAALRIEKDSMIQMERIARDELENKLQATKELEQRAVQANEQFKVMQAQAKEACEHSQLETDEQGKLVDEELQVLSENEIEDLEAALEEAEQKVNSIHNDPNAIKQYEANEREIEEVTEQLRKVEDHKSGLGRKIEQELSSWKAGLLNATQKINERFVRYMSELSVTGEVRLKRGGESGYEDCDFKDWGIEIRVSFREGVKAQVLSAQVQSGGERSVSTILFLMAMQDLMPSPFRCVDEINQGMDERNERAIFKRIVQNSTGPPKESPTDHCGQYFLITPKLLPSLLDMEQEAVTVLVVMNGPYNFDKPTDFNVGKIVAAARAQRNNKRLSVGDPEEDEENQHNIITMSNRRGS